MTIRSRVATDQYRRGWDRIFGNGEGGPWALPTEDPKYVGQKGHVVVTLNPHDADERPAAD